MLAAFPNLDVETGEPERVVVPARQCLAGESWTWNGVDFRIVHPHEPFSEHGNDRCCVLDVRSPAGELVLSGDISSAVEADVAAALDAVAPMLVLQVPHHGSKTSSGSAFVQALRPVYALVSAGYRNHFGHPAPTIVERYLQAGAEVFNSAQSGFVHLRFAPGAAPQVIERGRVNRHPYWRE